MDSYNGKLSRLKTTASLTALYNIVKETQPHAQSRGKKLVTRDMYLASKYT